MKLPSFNAEQSLYRSSRHYRSSAFASVVGSIRPSDALPPGSYQQSCFQCMYDGNLDLLSCACNDGNGCGQYTYLGEINSTCQGCDIYNSYGALGCC